MRRGQNEKSEDQGVEKSEELKERSFFFPNENRSIKAHSMSEARRILAMEKGETVEE